MFFRVAYGIGDLIALQSQGVRQDHLDRRAYVEKEIAGMQEQCERGYSANGSADRGTDDGTFSGAAWTGDA